MKASDRKLLYQRLNKNEDVLDEILSLGDSVLKTLIKHGNAFNETCYIIRRYGKKNLLAKIKLLIMLDNKNYLNSKNEYNFFDLEMLTALNEATPNNHVFVDQILRNVYLHNVNSVYEAIQIIKESKNDYNAEYATMVVTYSAAVKAGIALEGARIINESPNEFNARYAKDVLERSYCIEAGIALEGARIINESPNEFNAKYASTVLGNHWCIEAGIALEGAKIINESPNEFNAYFADWIISEQKCRHSGIALEGARIINESPNEFNAKFAKYIFINTLLRADLALEGAKIVNKAKNEEEAKKIAYYIDSNFVKFNALSRAEDMVEELNGFVETEEDKNPIDLLPNEENRHDNFEIDVKDSVRKRQKDTRK